MYLTGPGTFLCAPHHSDSRTVDVINVPRDKITCFCFFYRDNHFALFFFFFTKNKIHKNIEWNRRSFEYLLQIELYQWKNFFCSFTHFSHRKRRGIFRGSFVVDVTECCCVYGIRDLKRYLQEAIRDREISSPQSAFDLVGDLNVNHTIFGIPISFHQRLEKK